MTMKSENDIAFDKEEARYMLDNFEETKEWFNVEYKHVKSGKTHPMRHWFEVYTNWELCDCEITGNDYVTPYNEFADWASENLKKVEGE